MALLRVDTALVMCDLPASWASPVLLGRYWLGPPLHWSRAETSRHTQRRTHVHTPPPTQRVHMHCSGELCSGGLLTAGTQLSRLSRSSCSCRCGRRASSALDERERDIMLRILLRWRTVGGRAVLYLEKTQQGEGEPGSSSALSSPQL